MFKRKTTIVLGAGASSSYGYPIGNQLITRLIQRTKPSPEMKAIYTASHQYRREPEYRLHDALSFYDPISIDAFLTHYENDHSLINYAKSQIAQILLTIDNEDLFQHGANWELLGIKNSSATHWYRYLWDAIVAEQTADDIANDPNAMNFEIVTFNYENSLEYFLAKCVYSAQSMFNDEQKPKVVERLHSKIHHVYGSLNEHALSPGSTRKIPRIYYPPEDSYLLHNEMQPFSDSIHLINERRESDFSKIQNLLVKRDQIVFLGFGFDETNIGPQVLDLNRTLKAREEVFQNQEVLLPIVKYTNYGNSRIIDRRLQSIYLNSLPEGHKRDNVGLEEFQSRMFKSQKMVYQALAEDFQLNDL